MMSPIRGMQAMSRAQESHELNVFILDQVDDVRQGSVIGMISNELVINEMLKGQDSRIALVRVWGNKDQLKLDELLNSKAYELLLNQHKGASHG